MVGLILMIPASVIIFNLCCAIKQIVAWVFSVTYFNPFSLITRVPSPPKNHIKRTVPIFLLGEAQADIASPDFTLIARIDTFPHEVFTEI